MNSKSRIAFTESLINLANITLFAAFSMNPLRRSREFVPVFSSEPTEKEIKFLEDLEK